MDAHTCAQAEAKARGGCQEALFVTWTLHEVISGHVGLNNGPQD